MRRAREVMLAGALVLGCAPHAEPGEQPAPAWAEVTAVQVDELARTTARHDFAGNLELPRGEVGSFFRFYTPVVVARTGVYAGGKRLVRLEDGELPSDVVIADSKIASLRDQLEPLVAGRGRTHRIAVFADRRLRFANFWPVYRTIEHACDGWGARIVMRRAEDPAGTTQTGLSIYSTTDWDGKERYSGDGAPISKEPLTQVQLAVVVGPQQIEVGRLLESGEVLPLETIAAADDLAALARLAERLYRGRDPNAYGAAAALVWAHDDVPLERVLDVLMQLRGPKCTPAEQEAHETVGSTGCWFDISVKGRRGELAGLKLERW